MQSLNRYYKLQNNSYDAITVVNAQSASLKKEFHYYLIGIVLFLMPFTPLSILLWFAGFTILYYVFVVGFLFINRIKPEFVPENVTEMVHDENLVSEFNEVFAYVENVVKTRRFHKDEFIIALSKYVYLSVNVVLFMPKFVDRVWQKIIKLP